MRVDNVLEILRKADIQRLEIYLALDDLKQTIELIDCQVFNDSLRHSHDLFLGGSLSEGLADEVRVNSFQRRMATVDEIS